jgi:hypothetical protein
MQFRCGDNDNNSGNIYTKNEEPYFSHPSEMTRVRLLTLQLFDLQLRSIEQAGACIRISLEKAATAKILLK